MSASCLLAGYVVDKSSRDAETAVFGCEAAGAGTAWVDGGEVVRVGGVAEVDVAGGDDGIAETLGCPSTTRFIMNVLCWMGEKVV